MTDPYGINPLVDDARENRVPLFALASKERPAPTLFASGDLPPFTASGLDPQVLLRFPYTARHAAAAERDPAVVLGMLEQHAANPETTFDHQGLDDYRQRVADWLAGSGLPTQAVVEPGDDFYNALFPDELHQASEAQRQADIQRILSESQAAAKQRIAELGQGR